MLFFGKLYVFLLLNASVMALGSTLKCKLNYASIEASHLKCLKKEAIVSSIRKNFLVSEMLVKSCPKCHETFPEAIKFQYLFHRPLMALEIRAKDFGGSWVFVVFQGDSSLYRLWLYEIDEGNFQLREIKILEMSDALKAKFNDLSTAPNFATYWIN